MSLEKLPYTIVKEIFQYVDRKYYYPYLHVSKVWHILVKPIYYQEVTIANGRFGYLLQQLYQDSDLVDFNSFEYTQKLTIYDRRPNTSKLALCFRPDEVMTLFSFFMNIKVLKIDECMYKQPLIDMLIQLSPVNLFPQLEEIITNTVEEDESLLSLPLLYNRFGQTLKRANFLFESCADRADILKILSKWENMQNLTVTTSEYRTSDTLFLLLKACPRVSVIDFTITGFQRYSSDTIEKEESSLQELIKHMKFKNSFLKNLRTIKYESGNFLTAPYVNFFTNHCPKALDQLDIKFLDVGLFEWIKEMSLESILELAKSLSRIRTLTIKTSERGSSDSNEDIQDVHSFYKVLDTLVGGRKISSCAAYFTYRFDPSSIINISISDNSKISYTFSISPEKHNHNTQNINIYLREANDECVRFAIPSPPSYRFATGPQIISHLFFDIEESCYYIEDFNFDFLFLDQFFDYAIRNCPSLKSFRLSFVSEDSDRTRNVVSAKHQDCTSKLPLRDMAVVSIKGFHDELLRTKILVTYFPAMNVLHYSLNVRKKCVDEDDVISFDLTKYTNLLTFQFDFVDEMVEYYGGNEYIYFEISDDVDKIHMQCFKLNKNDYSLQPMSVELYEMQKDKPMNPNYFINIKCLKRLRRVEVSSYKLFDLDLLFPDIAYNPNETMSITIVTF